MHFSSITLVARKSGPMVKRSLQAFMYFLQSHDYNFQVDILTMSEHHLSDTTPVDFETVQDGLLICLGGDGSMLKLVQHAANYQLPVLGVNLGKMGFLADLSINQSESLLAILQGKYKICDRQLMTASFEENNTIKTIGPLLNEVTIHRTELNKTLAYQISVDDFPIASHHADGVIVATPTGSSAYALSAGGPIVAPELQSHIIVPICSHKLTSRPLCLPAQNTIRIHLQSDEKRPATISGDGHLLHPLPPKSTVTITASAKTLQLIHPLEYNFFATLKNKLHWEKTPHAEDANPK